jgi:gamma-glutamyl hercynylcysteine S-oxide synthase
MSIQIKRLVRRIAGTHGMIRGLGGTTQSSVLIGMTLMPTPTGAVLPTESEWEKACRGVDGQVFPWGNDWDPSRLHGAEAVFGAPFETIIDWRSELVRFDRSFPRITTAPVRAHEKNGASPFGVVDMLGNCWEYTGSTFATGRELQPCFKGFKPAEFMHAQEAQVVIKGGAWSSIPELTSAAYRGQDLLTDRHCEIGFRCVYRS